ncbi:MAG TPA: DUF3570 domain-containing protein [Gammaproteobacteria bacterium]
MQLKENRRRRPGSDTQIAPALAAATCALLGPGTPSAVVAQEQPLPELAPWSIDTAMLYYGESDGRVQDFSLSALARKELKEDGFLTLSFALDTLTGASPSGAAPSILPQTFTRPSGEDSYTVAAGEQPLDDTFQDTRFALAANWQWPVTRLALLDVGVSFSDEYDYTHTGVNARIARDFNNRNTTLSLGAALANDTIDAVGGAPIPLAPMLGTNDLRNRQSGDQSKDVLDLLLGLTQVVNRNTVVQINYSLSSADGYLTDPYKLLSVVDPDTGLPVAGPAGAGVNLHLFESRPESRDKQSVFVLLKRNLNGNVLGASYRHMTDDWGIDSDTVDLRYRFELGGNRYLQPHLRFYSQNAADFYHTVLFAGQPVPQFATADYRLGAFDAVTIGVKFGMDTRRGELSTRLELYQQTGDPDPAARVGALAGLDLYPDLSAIIAQFSYKFGR